MEPGAWRRCCWREPRRLLPARAVASSAAPKPASAGKKSAPGAVDRTQPPALSKPKPLEPPAVQTQKLANGLELVVIEMHEVPVVDVALLVPGRRGARSNRSTGPRHLHLHHARRRRRQAKRARHRRGGRIPGGRAVHGRVARERPGAVARAQAQSGRRPGFSWRTPATAAAAGVPRLRDHPAARAAQERPAPAPRPAHLAIAPLAFHAIVFGPQHPDGRPAGGTEASTAAALDRQQVVRFYETYYRPGNARMLVVGDVTLAEARELVEARFGSWKAAEVPARPQAQPPAPGKRTFYLVDKPGAAESVVIIGHVGAPALDARLLRAARAQYHPGRFVHVTAQPEPARDPRLHLWSALQLRHVPAGRTIPGRCLGGDRQDRQLADRVLQGAARHP